jgi:hypothetical protein
VLLLVEKEERRGARGDDVRGGLDDHLEQA